MKQKYRVEFIELPLPKERGFLPIASDNARPPPKAFYRDPHGAPQAQ